MLDVMQLYHDMSKKTRERPTVRSLSLAPAGVCNGISAHAAHHLYCTTFQRFTLICCLSRTASAGDGGSFINLRTRASVSTARK